MHLKQRRGQGSTATDSKCGTGRSKLLGRVNSQRLGLIDSHQGPGGRRERLKGSRRVGLLRGFLSNEYACDLRSSRGSLHDSP